ncbi:MAG: tRNA (cytidine(34)-2'-O)-methyltransferase [Cyanobacteria bacterium HKST-UBA03]|nr:tRNA (cytidine(34)-2'-O)-methyltransferase [Cyanobacteria bacterium HKST-UBA03]
MTVEPTLAEQSGLGVVLVEPRIPGNVGAIGRLCACTGSALYLVGDLGFSFGDKYLKRSGMDYLAHVEPVHVEDFEALRALNPDWGFSLLSTRARHCYTQIPFKRGHYLIFGSEATGLPEAVLTHYAQHAFRVPMLADRRSLNLATCASVVLYEGLRQLGGWPSHPTAGPALGPVVEPVVGPVVGPNAGSPK